MNCGGGNGLHIEVPDDFADRVIGAIHGTRRYRFQLFLLKLAAMAARSRTLRVGIFVFGLAVSLSRLGSILAIFIPS